MVWRFSLDLKWFFLLQKPVPNLQVWSPSWDKDQNRVSSVTVLESGIFLIAVASYGMNIPSIMSLFHLLVSGSIKQFTVVSSLDSNIGDVILVGFLIGSQGCYQILIDFPFATCQQAPCFITSLPLEMLFHAYDPEADSLASMKVCWGKNLALKIL